MKHSLLRAAALLCLTACGGGERAEGMTLELGLTTTRARSAVGAEAARTLVTNEGARASLSGAFVTLGSVELLPCEQSGWLRLLRGLSPVSTAWAHSTSSPLRLGTPHVVALPQADGTVMELGVMSPPPGRYCRARLTFEPADSDARGLTAAAEGAEGVDMVGRSLHLRGTLSPDLEPREFRVESRSRASVDVVLDGLTLSEEAPRAALVFALAWDTWLDGMAPQESPDEVDLTGNVARSATLHATP
ncbi:hypothetical protein [Myxococcus sp. RHSTA-1-4]|uniref:hypothetical protein n=1 Tax=Myxococcus sp. RHSTA-1-4 TaxID=2874601 RepID=UPI001CBDB68A|nr:hypothetical protein [Myxococcus sp. RHSTA-1-4]MBZ4417877.1 hypothetical protein [Myxococcus sp. RHSTA-1-4]